MDEGKHMSSTAWLLSGEVLFSRWSIFNVENMLTQNMSYVADHSGRWGEKHKVWIHLASAYGITMVLNRSNAYGRKFLGSLSKSCRVSWICVNGFFLQVELRLQACSASGYAASNCLPHGRRNANVWILAKWQRWILYASTNVWCQQMLGIPCTLVVGTHIWCSQPQLLAWLMLRCFDA